MNRATGESASRRSARLVLAGMLWLVSTSGCAKATESNPGSGGTGSASASASHGATSNGLFTGSSTGSGLPWDGLPWSAGDCPMATQFVYVVALDDGPAAHSTLYRYWPPTNVFTKVGVPVCGGGPVQALSMGIDRHAMAWIEAPPSVFRVDLTTGECTDSGFMGTAPLAEFGMAFTADGTAPDHERLFLAEGIFPDPSEPSPVRTLGWLDTATITTHVVGTAPMANTDLSGTGDGRLFAFEKTKTQSWSNLVELDPKTAAILSKTPLPGVAIGNNWAVAAWGGAVYLFTDSATTGTAVARYSPTTGKVDWMPGAPVAFHVIGAGVSTCAPITPPN